MNENEIQERARQYLADQILNLAYQINVMADTVADRRASFCLPPNPASVVQERAGRMAIGLAKVIARGDFELEVYGGGS